jgi:hypothetical protein
MKRMLLVLGASLFACTLRADVDINNDGLSDVWEFIYFNGPTDPYADSDHDGVRNSDEMVWGTDPTDPTSKFTAPAVGLDGDTLRLSWPAAPYRIYTLEVLRTFLTSYFPPNCRRSVFAG